MVTYKKSSDSWFFSTSHLKFTEIGSYGDAPEMKKTEFIQLTPSEFALLIEDGDSHMGENWSGKHIFLFNKDKSWKDAGYIKTESDNQGNCENADSDELCWGYKGVISTVASDKLFPDLQLINTGTELIDGKVIPARSRVYTFNEWSYQYSCGNDC